MNRLFWYVTRTLFAAIGIVWAGLLAFDAVFAFLGEVADIDRGDYGLPQVVAYTILTLPRRAYALFPMACLVGALLGLGNLAAKSELVAIRACGVSIFRIMIWSSLAGLAMVLVVLGIGEGLAPLAETEAGRLRAQAIFNRVAVQDERGIWVRDRQRYVHIGNARESTYLQDVQVMEFDKDHRLMYASQVKHARYDGKNWQLEDVLQTQFNNEVVTVVPIPQASWSLLVDPELIDVLAQDPDNMTLPELHRYIGYLRNNKISSLRYRMHFWSRIVQPMTAIMMLVLGTVFILVSHRRSGVGWRLLVGIVAGLSFKLVNDLLSQVGLVYGLPVVVSAFGPMLLVIISIIWLVRRAKT